LADEVTLHPASRKIRTPEQKRKYNNARSAWKQRKAKTGDGEWVSLGQEYNPTTGMLYIWEFNVETEMLRETRRFMLNQALLKQNAEEYANSNGKRFGDVAKVASLPPNLLFSDGWRQAYMEGDEKWINRKLNDPDYQRLRTFHGKL